MVYWGRCVRRGLTVGAVRVGLLHYQYCCAGRASGGDEAKVALAMLHAGAASTGEGEVGPIVGLPWLLAGAGDQASGDCCYYYYVRFGGGLAASRGSRGGGLDSGRH